jgi:hypothetical protein
MTAISTERLYLAAPMPTESFSNSTPSPPRPLSLPSPNPPGRLNLVGLGLPGQSYQAQYVTNLTQTNWCNLGGAVLATNRIGSQTDNTNGDPRRFYRVYLVP